MYNANYHKAVGAGKTAALKLIPFYAKWYRFQLLWASSDGLHASLHADPDWSTPDQSLNETNQKFRDTLIAYISGQVNGDPELLRKVVPPYPPYGKRMLRDNYWYKMLTRDNVDLVTDGDRADHRGRRRDEDRRVLAGRCAGAGDRLRGATHAGADAYRGPRRADDPRAVGRR